MIGTRPAIFLIGYLAVIVFGYPNGRPPVRDFADELRNLPSRFDARWYLQIASHGYAYDPAAPATVQQNIVFFPAYPMAIRLLARIAGNRVSNFFIAGTVLSLAAFLAALAYLYLLARTDLPGAQARVALWLLAAYPFAFFYGAVYTEAIFLLETVAAFYHFRRREYAACAMWGLLAGLTRPNGCLLAAPLALQAMLDQRRRTATTEVTAPATRPSLWRSLAASAAPVAGLLIYAVSTWRLTGSPWTWIAAQSAWGHQYHSVADVVTSRYKIIWASGLTGYMTALPFDFMNGLAVVFVLGTMWPVGRRLGLPYALWILINTWPSITAVNLISAGRYSSILFPVFIWLAGAVPARHRAGWIGSFAALQAFGAAMFYTWRPLY